MQVKLTTIGRKSGLPRVVTLNAFEDGDRLVVVGSWAGAPRDPAWASICEPSLMQCRPGPGVTGGDRP